MASFWGAEITQIGQLNWNLSHQVLTRSTFGKVIIIQH